MLEIVDLSQKLKKADYTNLAQTLRADLRDLQQAIQACGLPVVVVLEGWDAAGKGDSIGTLVYPLDPRGFKVYTTQAPTDEERYRPYLWRFWTKLPARGKFTFLDRSWYRRMLDERVDGQIGREGAMAAAAEIREFERQITDDGAVLIKFWLQISKKQQKVRLADIENDRYERWRLKQSGNRKRPSYRRSMEATEEMLALTSTANATWTIIASEDRYFRRAEVLRKVVEALRLALANRGDVLHGPAVRNPEQPEDKTRQSDVPPESRGEPSDVLNRVDLNCKLSRRDYETQLNDLQNRLRELELECYQQRVPVVVVYEGWDAAGKGGNIKRLTQELDPRGYEVIPIGAPDATEKAHHYLWRFWRQVPKAGHIAIFDRSWYGRVLVERVEGFATEEQWRRSYQEINEFERHLTDAGAVLLKFWLHLSPEEQLRRFQERENSPHKRYKITEEDWRNRSKWGFYHSAAAEMIERTSTSYGPWTIVEAEDKLWARVKTLKTLVQALEQRLGV